MAAGNMPLGFISLVCVVFRGWFVGISHLLGNLDEWKS